MKLDFPVADFHGNDHSGRFTIRAFESRSLNHPMQGPVRFEPRGRLGEVLSEVGKQFGREGERQCFSRVLLDQRTQLRRASAQDFRSTAAEGCCAFRVAVPEKSVSAQQLIVQTMDRLRTLGSRLTGSHDGCAGSGRSIHLPGRRLAQDPANEESSADSYGSNRKTHSKRHTCLRFVYRPRAGVPGGTNRLNVLKILL